MSKKDKQSKFWSFVIFTIDLHSKDAEGLQRINNELRERCLKLKDIKYFIFQLEKCPTTGSLHFDGFLYFNKQKRFTTIVNYFKKNKDYELYFKHPSIELVKNIKAKMNYSQKIDTRMTDPIEYGVPPKISHGPASLVQQEFSKTTAELIKEGYDSAWFAYHRPELYLRYGNRLRDCIAERELYQKSNDFLTETKDNQEEE